MSTLPKACVIGAGSSGLAACKALRQYGVPFDCFEMSDNIGGNWYYKNPNGKSSAYNKLHIDTSKSRMQYADLPMSDDYPNYAHHTQVFEYFNKFCDHYGLRDLITFNTEVLKAERAKDGVWTVTLSNGEERRYDAVLVCNGHHWDPRWPEPPFPGDFHGTVMHSHYFDSAEEFRGKNVVVLGMGNSAMDIAVECSYVANNVYLAHRRGAYIIPKYLMGRPADKWVVPWFPWWFNRILMAPLLRLYVGRYENYGLKKPDHRLMEAHPSVSSHILDRIAHGEIKPRSNIAELMGDKVKFDDGKVEDVDAIIYCTGYKVTFPFFDESFVSAPDNDLPLYLRMFKPDIENLIFIGLFQPLGAIFPIAELQGEIAAAWLAGKYALPLDREMRAEMEQERQKVFSRYVKSKRHTMQVDYDAFMRRLNRELKRGAMRANAEGNVPGVKARA